MEIDHLFGQRFGATAQRAFLGEPVAILAGRDRTTRILSFDQRLFRAIAPPQGGAFTILPADGDH